MPYDPSYAAFVRWAPILDVISREKPDVLEIHSPYVAAFAALRAPKGDFGIRTFQWHSDFLDTYAGVFASRFGARAGKAREVMGSMLEPGWSWVRKIAGECDGTLVSAKWQLEKLRAHGVPRLHHIPFGLERFESGAMRTTDDAKRSRIREANRTVRDRARVSADTPLFFAVGRQAMEKRWDVVIDAFIAHRVSRGPGALVFLGDGPERKRLEKRAAGRSDIVFLGFEKDRERYGALLSCATALLHACPYETFGLAIAEGLGRGIPAIVPDAGGAGELIDDGVGEVYEPLDVAACTAAMGRFLARDGTDLRRAAEARARQLPSALDQFTEQLALYETLLSGRSV